MKNGFNPAFFKTGPDMSVYTSLPMGLTELRHAKPRRAVGKGNRQAHYCTECGGWIDGAALCQIEDDLPEFMDGRRGRVLRCRRMGHELSFTGVYNKEVEVIEDDKEQQPKTTEQTNPRVFRIARGSGGIPT